MSSPAQPVADTTTPQITILYDAFGSTSTMRKGWGFAALIEYDGKRILFDTGADREILAHNVAATGVDLSRLDFIVMSHRHGDHMGGLSYVLTLNPAVTIYAPKENFGVYGFSLPSSFYRKEPSLPAEQRYYGGSPPEVLQSGSAWPDADFELIEKSTEIAEGIHLIALVSEKPGTLELRELSLAIETLEGLLIIVGCSHPGVEKIVEAATVIDDQIQLIAGGFHLPAASDAEIQGIVTQLTQTFRVHSVAPGHCTGEPTFVALQKAFGERYVYAGVGSVLSLDGLPTVGSVTRGVPADEASPRSASGIHTTRVRTRSR